MEEFYEFLSNENSRNTFSTLMNKMNEYERMVNKKFSELTEEEIAEFFLKYYSDKTSATICNTLTMLKRVYSYHNLNLDYLSIKFLKSHGLKIKEQSFFSPSEIKEIVDSLLNAQDKALVMLTYIGFYDEDFKTIRNLKKSQIQFDKIVFEDKEIKVSSYLEEILLDALLEEFNYKYTGNLDTYDLNDTAFLFRGRNSKNKDILSSATLKKRFKMISDYFGIENFTAINVKSSGTLYKLVKEENKIGRDLKRHEIRNYCVLNNIKAGIEQLEKRLKDTRGKIKNDIFNEKDTFIG